MWIYKSTLRGFYLLIFGFVVDFYVDLFLWIMGATLKKTAIKKGKDMAYNEDAAQRYREMCRIIGDRVIAMVSEGRETRKEAIADALRTEMQNGYGKWSADQLGLIEFAIELLEE